MTKKTDHTEESVAMQSDATPRVHSGDKALFEAAATGKGAIPLTPQLFEQISENLRSRQAQIEEEYPVLVRSVPEETRIAIAAQVMRAIVEHAREGGSFRYLIYERLGFTEAAYVPLYHAGGMTISNEFELDGDGLAKRHSGGVAPPDEAET